jgi:hypothetical protein
MAEVRCERHGVFAYKSAVCPGCATEQQMAEDAALSETRDQVLALVQQIKTLVDAEKEERRLQRQRKQAELNRAAQDAQTARDRHSLQAPAKPEGLDAWLKRRAYEEAERAFVAEAAQLEGGVKAARLAAEQFAIEAKAAEAADEDSLTIEKFGAFAAKKLVEQDPEAAHQLYLAYTRSVEFTQAQQQAWQAQQQAWQEEQERMGAALAALDETYGDDHRLGGVGEKWRQHLLLGAADLCGKRYARLKEAWDSQVVICVPWIDAFAEHIGKQINVEWPKPPEVPSFRISERDGRIFE